MKARKWGRIINTASAHSLVASPFKVAYVTAKHGLAGLTKTVALEVATFGITVNCISPGYVWTPLVEKQIPDTMKARNMTEEQVKHDVLLAAQPTKEFVTVEQVAALAVYLCSDAAAPITGANLSIDGGWTARVMKHPASPRARRRPKHSAAERQEAHQSRAAGRRRAWRLHLGRARPSPERRAARDRRHFRHLGGRDQCGDAGRRPRPRRARRRRSKRLADFWRAASSDGDLPALQRAVIERLFSFMPLEGTPMQAWFDALSRYFSPYDSTRSTSIRSRT